MVRGQDEFATPQGRGKLNTHVLREIGAIWLDEIEQKAVIEAFDRRRTVKEQGVKLGIHRLFEEVRSDYYEWQYPTIWRIPSFRWE
jgi:hypothetical protein